MNGNFADAEVRFGSPTHLRQHLDTKKRKGHREALKEHEARGAGSKDRGSGGASSEKDAGSIIAFMDGVKPYTSKMVRFIIGSSNNRWFRIYLRSSSTRAFRARLGETFINEQHHRGIQDLFSSEDNFCTANLVMSLLFRSYPRQVILRLKQLLSRSSSLG